ncbi:MAG TPA: alpha/beta hydrolase [Acidimicrobiales bacterium]|nr:alpha/beta hydrolase [Acidimicrobiales bacterium]
MATLPNRVGGPAASRRLALRNPLTLVRDQVQRPATRRKVSMVGGELVVDGRRLAYTLSDNEDACGPDGLGSAPIWAVNLHGYFAGGAMYSRESARLAERFGWRVLNPSLPGFGGSDPLPWGAISMTTLTEEVERLLGHVGAGPAVVLGHSMGGAVAVEFARRNLQRTLGIVYRDGVATPAWKERRGIIPFLLSPILPDVAPMADLMAAIVLDAPDLLLGQVISTLRSMAPDFRQNMRTMGRTAPVGSMLMTVDQRPEVTWLGQTGLPLLAEWGCFDRVATPAAAKEFSDCAGTPIQWLPGGHSWMLARPRGQSDVFEHLPTGRDFVERVEERWRSLVSGAPVLEAVN